MEVSITCKLLNKSILLDGELLDVHGLAELHVCPASRCLGRLALDALSKLCIDDYKHCVVGFAGDDVVGFYRSCGWFTGERYGDKTLIASVHLSGNIVVSETW
jgi:hypothetical protein